MKIIKKLTALTTITLLAFVFAVNTYAVSLLASGNFTAEAGGTTLNVEFIVKDTDPVSGSVMYSNSAGGNFNGSVSCYYRDGNEAAIGGSIVSGNYTEGYFLMEVQDNDSSDLVRVRVFDSMPNCELSGSFPGVVTEGKLTLIDKVPEGPKTLVVDDNKLECPDASYKTIQDAVNAANPGDTVKVCTGVYKGALIDKKLDLVGYGKNDVVIKSGPESHARRFRAGFLFNPDYSGSGSTIKSFRFEGAMQETAADDGLLDFAVFSRGADNVKLEMNIMNNTLQAITNWHGDKWTIERNKINGLWTMNGGGIGVFIGSFNGTGAAGNNVAYNVILGPVSVHPTDLGGYNGTGIALFSDYRYGSTGGEIVRNSVHDNRVKLTSNNPDVVDAVAFEATDTRDDETAVGYPVVYDNSIINNMFNGSSIEYDFTPDDLVNHNNYSGNTY